MNMPCTVGILAQRMCNELGGLASTTMGVDMELKVEASPCEARTLLAARQYRQAANVAHSLFCTCHKFNLQIEKAPVLLLLAEIHKVGLSTWIFSKHQLLSRWPSCGLVLDQIMQNER